MGLSSWLFLFWVLRVLPREVCRGTPSAEGHGPTSVTPEHKTMTRTALSIPASNPHYANEKKIGCFHADLTLETAVQHHLRWLCSVHPVSLFFMLPTAADGNNGPLPTCVAVPAVGGKLNGRDEQPWLLQVPVNETLQPNRGKKEEGCIRKSSAARRVRPPHCFIFPAGEWSPICHDSETSQAATCTSHPEPVAGMWRDL